MSSLGLGERRQSGVLWYHGMDMDMDMDTASATVILATTEDGEPPSALSRHQGEIRSLYTYIHMLHLFVHFKNAYFS